MSEREREVGGRLAQLRRWRDAAVASGQRGADAVRDIHLSMVARSGRQGAQAIAEVLPASLKAFATPMANALGTGQDEGTVLRPPPGAAPPGTPQAGPAGGRPGGPPPGPQHAPSATRPGGLVPPGSVPSAPVPPRPSSSGGPVAPGSAGAARGPGGYGSATGPGGYGSAGGPSSAGGPGRPSAPPPGYPPTAPPPETAEQRRERLVAAWERFAPLDHSEPPGSPGRLQAAAAPGGAVRLRWEPYRGDEPTTIYRVCSGDDFAPYDPHQADYVAVTTELSCTDDRPFVAAVRHLQVWRNSGAGIDDAHAHQPVLHAEATVVAPVSEVDLREDEGRVIGQWQTFGEIRRVQVYRVPVERANAGVGDPAYRILADADNLGGFVDRDAERGRRYVYQFACEASYDGAIRLSAFVTRPLLVSAVLEPVTDLQVQVDDDPDAPEFDLTWTAPSAGRVLIFRTEAGPRAGATNEVHAESVLPQMNLPDTARLAHPIVREGAQAAMRDVPWPRGWVRTYFTAVTVLDGRVQVGATVPAVRTRSVTDPVVVERTHTQVLKFGWPTGAAEVSVFLGARGQTAEQAMQAQRPIDITAKDYERFGGMQFTRQLPIRGCSLHLIGVSYSGGERITSAPVSVDYPGLVRLSYEVNLRRGRIGRGPTLAIRIASETELRPAPPFVLVHNSDRFPLDRGDGDPVEVREESDQAVMSVRRFTPQRLDAQWSSQTWLAAPPGPGFVRLFVDLDPDQAQGLALLDPAIDALILQA